MAAPKKNPLVLAHRNWLNKATLRIREGFIGEAHTIFMICIFYIFFFLLAVLCLGVSSSGLSVVNSWSAEQYSKSDSGGGVGALHIYMCSPIEMNKWKCLPQISFGWLCFSCFYLLFEFNRQAICFAERVDCLAVFAFHPFLIHSGHGTVLVAFLFALLLLFVINCLVVIPLRL